MRKPKVSTLSDYRSFVAQKEQRYGDGGFSPLWMPEFLFDFQRVLVEWAVRKGRAAIFADCGMGKTPMQLVWAENVVRKTNRPVLILTPLAVQSQTLREAEKFGVDVERAHGTPSRAVITITNYERLHHLSPSDFVGVVCDESSILKSFEGVTKAQVTNFMRRMDYRLLCTATAAPNDFVELGTSSEALGYLGFMDMLNRFFKNARNNSALQRAWGTSGGGTQVWSFKGHAEQVFWRWVCSWARSVRKPSDLGEFDNSQFALPERVESEHEVASKSPRPGMLFALPAVGLAEERAERRRTIQERCERVAELVAESDSAITWCHLNDEGDVLESLIPGCVQVSGKDSDEAKEEKFEAFTNGQARVLVTKPIIGAWGMNWQHCAHMTSFVSHSFEQYYQSVRRIWRYGQTRSVRIDHVLSDGEGRVMANLRRKQEQADMMFARLVEYMSAAMIVDNYRDFSEKAQVPSWL